MNGQNAPTPERFQRRRFYEFTVVGAREGRSSSGNEMFTLRLKVTGEDGVSEIIVDYLMPGSMAKLKSCCVTLGIEDKFDLGLLLAGDFLSRSGRASFKFERGRNGYSDRNVVDKYEEKKHD